MTLNRTAGHNDSFLVLDRQLVNTAWAAVTRHAQTNNRFDSTHFHDPEEAGFNAWKRDVRPGGGEAESLKLFTGERPIGWIQGGGSFDDVNLAWTRAPAGGHLSVCDTQRR